MVMDINLYEPFETEFFKLFKNAQVKLNDESIFTIMTKKFKSPESNIEAWKWLYENMTNDSSKEKIKFIIDNWSVKLIENIVNC